MAETQSVSTARSPIAARDEPGAARGSAKPGIEEDAAAFAEASNRALNPKSRQQTLEQFEKAKAEAKARYESDKAKLAEFQEMLTAQQKYPPMFPDEFGTGDIWMEREAEAQRAQVDADKNKLDVAASDYRGALAAQDTASTVQAAAINYAPADPTVTAGTPAANALKPVLDEQRQAAAAALARNDQQAFYRADASVAAATIAAYSQQIPADQAAVKEAAAKFKKLHLTLDVYGNPIAIDANGKPTNASITPEQQAAFGGLWSALSKYNTDLTVMALSQARLQLYASDKTKYGTVASDAVTRINQVLSRGYIKDAMGGTLALRPVKAIDAQKAKAALEEATQALAHASAEWNSARSFGTYSEALLRLQKIPEGQKEPREQAELELARTKANYDQASGYLAKLAAQQALAVARAKYIAESTPANALALEQAREQLVLADANLLAATAAVHLVDLHGKLKDQPLDQQRAQLRAAELTLNNLRANANLLGTNLAIAGLESALKQAPEAERSQLQQRIDSARLQRLAAQFQLDASQFALTVPAHLLDAKTPQDQAALQEAFSNFFSRHPDGLSDPQVAAQLLGLGPGEKVDVQKGIDEIHGFLNQTEKDLANHTMLQKTADFFGGLFGASRSKIESTLKEDLTALQELQARKQSMGAADFNSAYLGIMGKLSTHFYIQSLAESRSAEHWSAAQEVVRAVLVTGAAMGVTAVTLGWGAPLGVAILAGGAVGFVTSEGIDAGQNATTLHSGGDLRTNRHIGLLTPTTNNFFYGGVTGDEWGRAGVNAAGNVLTSGASAAGMGFGRLASQYVMTSTMPTILARLGVGGLVVAAADAGPAARAMVAAMNAQNVSVPVGYFINAASGSVGGTTTQGFMAVGQVAANEFDVRYEEAAGRITHEQAQEQRRMVGGSALAGIAMGPIAGPAGAFVPNTFWAQLGANAIGNTAFVAGVSSLTGRPLDANDALNAALNTLVGTGIHAGNRFFNSPGAVAGEPYAGMATYKTLYERMGSPAGFPAPAELEAGGAPGRFSSGGSANSQAGSLSPAAPGPGRIKANWALIAGGSVALEAASSIPGVSDVMDVHDPAMVGATLTEAGFTFRGALLYAKIRFENAMRDTVSALKDGRITGERLDWLISRITETAGYKGISDEQLLRVTWATEEFRRSYDALGALDETERTTQRRALGQEYWRTLSRIFGVKEEDLAKGKDLDPLIFSPFDPSAPSGIALRAGIMATYAANVVVASQSGLLPAWSDLGNVPAYLSKIGFFAGNSGGWALTARALIEGMNGRNVEVSPGQMRLAEINSWIFTGAGLAWATGDGFKLVSDILAHHPVHSAEDAAGVAIKLAYTYAQYRLSRSATAKLRGEPGLDAKQAQKTIYVLAAALALSQALHAVVNWDRLAEKLQSQGNKGENNQPSLPEMLKEVEKAMERDRKGGPAHAPGPIAVPGVAFTPIAPSQLAAPAAGEQFAVTVRGGAHLREGPGEQYKPRTTLRRGDLFKAKGGEAGAAVDDENNQWISGTARRDDGWVRRDFVAPQPNGVQFPNGGRYSTKGEADAKARPAKAIAVNVHLGDTLSKIVERFGLLHKLDIIKNYNDHLLNPDQLNIHDRIYIPTDLINERRHRHRHH